MPGDDNARVSGIAKRGPGYSTAMHYRFFRQVLIALSGREPTAVMLGVYFARDLMMIADLLDREFSGLKSSMRITGVDKFEDAACDDWPDSVRGLGWQSAGFGHPPNLSMAQDLIGKFARGARIELVKQRAEKLPCVVTGPKPRMDLYRYSTRLRIDQEPHNDMPVEA